MQTPQLQRCTASSCGYRAAFLKSLIGLFEPDPSANSNVTTVPSAPIDAVTPVTVQEKATNNTSILILILLFLTFFTPLGPILMLPMIGIGIMAAFGAVRGNKQTYIGTKGVKQNPVILAITLLFKGVMVLVLGIVGLIAFLFIAVATGAVDFRVGS